MAEAELRRAPLKDRYTAVIVDEAQDLSCAMIRMLHGLVGDRPDGLTLIGDGQQTIYPGGYTLAEAGVSIAGPRRRARRQLPQHRRDPRVRVPDGRGRRVRRHRRCRGCEATRPRAGAAPRFRPVYIVFSVPRASTTQRSSSASRRFSRSVGTGFGDIGVLCALNRYGMQRVRLQALTTAGIPSGRAGRSTTGAPSTRVKVGTDQARQGTRVQAGARRATSSAAWFAADADGRRTDGERERRDYRAARALRRDDPGPRRALGRRRLGHTPAPGMLGERLSVSSLR